MDKVMRIVSLLIIAGFFVLAGFLLFSPSFDYLPREVRVIFSIFLVLYGLFRLARTYMKRPRKEEEERE